MTNPKQIICVVALIKNEAGELLLAKRHEPQNPTIHGIWEFIGGSMEFGEDPEVTVQREVKEESGLDVTVTGLFPKILYDVSTSHSGEKYHIIIITYYCKIIGGSLQVLPSENSEFKFVAPAEIKNFNAFKNIYQTADIISTLETNPLHKRT